MNKTAVLGLMVLACVQVAGCAQTVPPVPPGPPVANATPPPLPADPALGPHATQGPAQGTARPAPAPR